ncbi:Crp/Fnr family transcriptional regulator (plasmid) [Anaerobacillus sp. CMMVII]|nr:Crp/Fnr family transcriptional regulator [Anaerobacillus sp. CMMVII]
MFIKKGNSLFLEGDAPTHIYLIKSGKVRLSKTNVEGKILFFQFKQQDDFVGELSLYNNLRATCNADVIKDAKLIRFERVVLEEICRQNGTFALAFMKWFSKHSNSLLAQFRDLIFCGKKGALFSILIRLSNAHGKRVEDGILIDKKLTNQELANHIGATRESISRILKHLVNDQIISINSKYITIHNIQFLQDQLRCEHCAYEECTI